MTQYLNQFLLGDSKDKLALLADGSVRCIVTSPPYYGLRDYGNEAQIGLEETPEKYIANLVAVFDEARRVLTDDGTLWLNIGDSYANSGTGGNGATGGRDKSTLQSKMPPIGTTPINKKIPLGMKAKDLIGIPWMVAFALRAAGWYLRQDIIWHKPNPMPESVTDRCTKSHEYLFLFSKSAKYYFDAAAISTPYADKTLTTFGCDVSAFVFAENRAKTMSERKPKDSTRQRGSLRPQEGFNAKWDLMSKLEQQQNGANKRSVWTVATKPYKDAHFATFPPELITDCIKAGSAIGDAILDPFSGAGTTAMVAQKLDRNFIGIELNSKYIKIAEKRLDKELGMFRGFKLKATKDPADERSVATKLNRRHGPC